MNKRFKAIAWTAALGLVAGAIAGCDGDDDVSPDPDRGDGGSSSGNVVEGGTGLYKARVRRTTAGIPHVQSDDFGGLGFGYGYVFAEDNLCLLAEEILTVRGERAKYFGDVGYDLGNSSASSNVSSDAFYKMTFTNDIVDRYRAAHTPDLVALIEGYAAGVSKYVRELKAGEHTGRHSSCRGEEWVHEFTDEDMYLRMYKLNLIASSAGFIDGFAAAVPPQARAGGAAPRPTPKHPSRELLQSVEHGMRELLPKFFAHRDGELGSNMYAFGSEMTGGAGIQFGNPHFPWYGGERLYQVHLTVPGKMDVQGSSLYGVPVVLIGFTENFAWSHTVSTAYRFTPYQLKLKEGDPLTYIQDGVEKPITAVDQEIEVKDGAGTKKVTKRLYRSEYGPMIRLSSNELFGWNQSQAFTIRDANAENFRLFTNFFRWNQAKSLDEFIAIHKELVAVPWVNTTAADRTGRVYYGDLTVVPNVSDAKAAACASSRTPLLASAAPGLPLLDGSRAECKWDTDPSAPAGQKDILPASKLPSVERNDWVVNCNDSYWLTNSTEPMPAFDKIVGLVNYPQSLRSRLCHQQVLDRRASADGFEGTGVTVDIVKQMVLRSRVYSAEKFRQQVLDGICTQATIALTRDSFLNKDFSPAVEVETADACAALRAWDAHNNPDSVGSLVWDEFWFRIDRLASDPALRVFSTAFDPADPVNTPADLDTSRAYVVQAFAAGVHAITSAGFDFATPRSQISYRLAADGTRIPVPGGYQRTGNFTIAQAREPFLSAGVGYGPVNYGNSYMQVVGFLDGGRLDAHTFVTYSQSTDPGSPHFDDYSRRYASKDWLKAAFTEEEVAAQTTEDRELAD